MRIHGLDVGSLKAHNTLYVEAMKGAPRFGGVEREMVAPGSDPIVVSRHEGRG